MHVLIFMLGQYTLSYQEIVKQNKNSHNVQVTEDRSIALGAAHLKEFSDHRIQVQLVAGSLGQPVARKDLTAAAELASSWFVMGAPLARPAPAVQLA